MRLSLFFSAALIIGALTLMAIVVPGDVAGLMCATVLECTAA